LSPPAPMAEGSCICGSAARNSVISNFENGCSARELGNAIPEYCQKFERNGWGG
jgi:hypothetical protein